MHGAAGADGEQAMWHTNDGMGWWMVFMGVFWVLFWGSLIWLFIAAVVRPSHDRDHNVEPDALEIAKRRLARGEISSDQYQEIRRHLTGGPAPQP